MRAKNAKLPRECFRDLGWHADCIKALLREVPTVRIEKHPILEFGERKTVLFMFDGKPMEGYEGEPIASALHAAGVAALRHSHRLGRPRGLFCAIGNCSSCLMTVDGVPNVRVCVEPLKEGMQVSTQTGRGKLL